MNVRAPFYQLMFIVSLAGCNYPDDPNQTLKTIQKNHLIKVGFCSSVKQGLPLLNKLSQKLDARVLKVVDAPDRLYKQLEKNRPVAKRR